MKKGRRATLSPDKLQGYLTGFHRIRRILVEGHVPRARKSDQDRSPEYKQGLTLGARAAIKRYREAEE